MRTAWSHLTDRQQEAAKAAARLLADADLRFLMLLFGADKAGAILANIEPADSVKLIEGALAAAIAAAAKDEADLEEVQIEQGRVH